MTYSDLSLLYLVQALLFPRRESSPGHEVIEIDLTACSVSGNAYIIYLEQVSSDTSCSTLTWLLDLSVTGRSVGWCTCCSCGTVRDRYQLAQRANTPVPGGDDGRVANSCRKSANRLQEKAKTENDRAEEETNSATFRKLSGTNSIRLHSIDTRSESYQHQVVKRRHRLTGRVRMKHRERKAYGKACRKHFSTGRCARYLHRYLTDRINRRQILLTVHGIPRSISKIRS